MLISVTPSISQMRRYAESARSGFETLNVVDAIHNAKCELDTLLEYLIRLDVAEDAVCESFVGSVESGVKLKLSLGDFNGFDHT